MTLKTDNKLIEKLAKGENFTRYCSSSKKAWYLVSDLYNYMNPGHQLTSQTKSHRGRKCSRMYSENELFSFSYDYESHTLTVEFK